jgi:hypothetical protein
LILPTHRLPILAKVPDERQQKVPPDGIVGPFRNKIAVDIPVEADILVQDIIRRKTYPGHIILEQFPVDPRIPPDRIIILFKNTGPFP